MSTFGWIALIILALIVGVALGFYLARRTMDKYLAENPPFDERMIADLLTQMGQKPSAKRVNQIMNSMKKQ